MKPSPALAAVQSNRPLVIAHRGHNKVAPENTLPAFAAALPLGVDFVELDYFHSADGVPIVFHDQTLDRCTDAYRKWRGKKIPLASKSLAELRTLDAGAWFDPKFAGTRIATLEEALDVIQPGSMTLIERKGATPRRLSSCCDARKPSRVSPCKPSTGTTWLTFTGSRRRSSPARWATRNSPPGDWNRWSPAAQASWAGNTRT